MSTQPPLPAGAEEISTAGFNLYVGPIYRLPDVRAGGMGVSVSPSPKNT